MRIKFSITINGRNLFNILILPTVPREGEWVELHGGGWTERVRSVDWQLHDHSKPQCYVTVSLGSHSSTDDQIDALQKAGWD